VLTDSVRILGRSRCDFRLGNYKTCSISQGFGPCLRSHADTGIFHPCITIVDRRKAGILFRRQSDFQISKNDSVHKFSSPLISRNY
jgi:hypothetical protein